MTPSSIDKRRALIALLLLVPVPTLGTVLLTWVPFTKGTPLGQGAYFASKLWILLVPLIWLKLVAHKRLRFSVPTRDGLALAFGLGLSAALAIWLVYTFLGSAWIDADYMREQVGASGFASPARFLFISAYLVIVNALLEEFVWRWFVYSRCETLMGRGPAVVAAALFFTLHHIFVLAGQFDWRVTVLGSIGVFCGGVVWSWLYARYRSLWPGYVSHMIVDIAILSVGWHLLFGQSAS